MKTSFSFLILALVFSCSSAQRGPSGSGNVLNKAQVYFEFLDSGLDESKQNYEVYAEVFSSSPDSIKIIQVVVDGQKKDIIPVKKDDGRYFINAKLPYHLPIQSTLFFVKMEDGKSRYIELECTREEHCLQD